MFNKGVETTSFGRNGTMRTTGLDVTFFDFGSGEFTSFSPITSKGLAGKCRIEIPAESCPFHALDALIESQKENLPTLMGIHPLLDKLIAEKLAKENQSA
jgi:hypothetical protein